MTAVLALVEPRVITGEELLAMGDVGPCELIDGRIVPMNPTGGQHGMIEFNLGLELGLFVRQRQLGWVVGGEVGIYICRHPDRVRGADVAFISRDRMPGGPPQGFLQVPPELVVEIISPDDRWQEMQQKIKDYFAIGVQRVWIVEPEARTVLVYRSSTEMHQFSAGDTLVGEGMLEGFALPVADLFKLVP
jgi:Uma2 family endonuclease